MTENSQWRTLTIECDQQIYLKYINFYNDNPKHLKRWILMKVWWKISLEKFYFSKFKFPGISPKSPQKEAFKLTKVNLNLGQEI